MARQTRGAFCYMNSRTGRCLDSREAAAKLNSAGLALPVAPRADPMSFFVIPASEG